MRHAVNVLTLAALAACLLVTAEAAWTSTAPWSTGKQDDMACTKDIDSCTMQYQTSPGTCESEYKFSDCLRRISTCVGQNYFRLQSVQQAVDDAVRVCGTAVASAASPMLVSRLLILPFFALFKHFVL